MEFAKYMVSSLWLFNLAMGNGPFKDWKHDDLPIKHADFPVRYVKSPVRLWNHYEITKNHYKSLSITINHY